MKGAFMRAALHAAGAPLLFIPQLAAWAGEKRAQAFFEDDIPHYIRVTQENKVKELSEGNPLRDHIVAEARRAGITIGHVFFGEDPKAGPFNAEILYVSGRNPVLIMQNNPLRLHDGAALLRGIVSHELAHVRQERSYTYRLFNTTKLLLFGIAWGSLLLSLAAAYNNLALPSIAAAGGALAGLGALTGTALLHAAHQRNDEYLADMEGAVIAGGPDCVIKTLESLAGLPYPRSRIVRLFMHHPPTPDRLSVLRQEFNGAANPEFTQPPGPAEAARRHDFRDNPPGPSI